MNYDSTNISTSTRKFKDMSSTVPKLRNDSKHISDIDSKIIPVLNEKKKKTNIYIRIKYSRTVIIKKSYTQYIRLC